VPRSCSSPISARICSLTRANSGNPTYFRPFSFSTVCAMSGTILLTVFTVNSIYRRVVSQYFQAHSSQNYYRSRINDWHSITRRLRMRRQKETPMKLRILLILCCVLLPAASSFGQTAPDKTPDIATDLRNGFNEVNGWVVKAAEMVPAEKYNYRPV